MTPGLDIPLIAMQFVLLLMALTVHECAHAWTADRLGDPTARHLGRVSLSPLPHIDPVGTVLFPLIGAIWGVPLIGWAKPTPVNPMNLAHPRRDGLWISAAGPITNLLLASGFLLLLAVAGRGGLLSLSGDDSLSGSLLQFGILGVLINVMIAVFNMIPIPPLDGAGVLAGMLPEGMAAALDSVRRFGMLALYALVLIPIGGQSLLGWIFAPIRQVVLRAVALAIGA